MTKTNTLRHLIKWLILLIIPLFFNQNLSSQDIDSIVDIVGCSGTNRGKVTVMVTGGSPRYNYFIRSGGILGTPLASKEFTTDTFAVFQNLNQGTYGVIVYHNDAAAGAPWGTFVDAFEFTIQYLGFDPITVVKGLTCFDGNDAEIKANPKGGIPPYSYAWSNGDITQIATGIGQGIHSVTITDQKTCWVKSTILFFKNYYPTYIPDEIFVSSIATGTCQGFTNGTITVTGSGGTGDLDYAIVRVATSDSTFQATNVFTNLAAGTYRVYVIDNNGCIARQVPDAIVAEYPNPVASASSNSPVCVGSPLNLSSLPNGMTSYSWSGPNGYTSNQQNPQVSLNATPAMAGVYTVTVTDANGCSNTANTTVVVNALPTPTASNNGPVCEGQLLQVSALPNAMTSYSWTGPNGFTSNQQNPVVSPNATMAMAGTYTVTVTDGNLCVNSAFTVAVVIQAPTADAGSDASICVGSTHTLNGTATNYSSLLWTSSGTGSFNDPNIEDPIYTPSAADITAGSVVLTFTAFGNAPCGNAADNMTLTIIPAPTADAGPDASICEGSTHTLDGTATNYSSLLWTSSGTGSFNDPNIDDPIYTPSAADITSGSVILTLTAFGNAPCGNAADNMTLTIIPAPTANAGLDASICAGSTYTLNGTATNYSSLLWTSSGTGLFNDPNIEDPIYTPSAADIASGSVILTLTAFGNAPCVNAADNMTLTINLPPSANAGPDASICEGSTYTLDGTATNYSSLLWTSSGTGLFNNPNIEDPIYTPSAADIAGGSVILTLTAFGNAPCSDASDNMTLTIIPAPTANAGPDASICEGSTYTLDGTATNYSSLLWTSSGTGSFNNPAIEDPVYTPSAADITAGSVVLTLTAFGNAPCSNAADNMTLTIIPAPTADAGPDASICEGTTHTLDGTATNYSSLLWTSSGTGSFNNPVIEDPIYTPSAADIASGSVILTLTAFGNASCSDASDNMTLTIIPAPTADAGPDASICEGSTHTLNGTATNYSSLLWTTSGTGSFNDPNIEDPIYTPSAADITGGSVILTLTAFGNAPCSNAADNMTLTIIPAPTADAGPDASTCEGSTHTLDGTATNYSSLLWTSSGTGSFNNPAIEDPIYTPSAADITSGSVILTLTAFGNAPCSDASDNMTLTIIPAPTANAGPDASICEGSTHTLDGTATNYSSLLWTTSGTGSFNDPNIEDPIYTPSAADITSGSVILTLTAFGNAPCGNAADNMTLTIIHAPTADAGPDASTCEGSTHTLDGTATNYSSLLWTTSGTGSFNNPAIEDPIYTPSAADIAGGSVILTLTAFGNAPCSDASDNMTLTIIPAPTADAGPDDIICEGSTYTLDGTATNYSSLLWTSSGTGSFNDPNIEDPIYTPSAADIAGGSVILTLTAFGNAPCSDAVDNMTLTLIQASTADAGPDDIICEGSTHTLDGTATNYSSLLWTTSGTGSFNDPNIEDPIYTPSAADIASGSVILTLTAFGNAPCGNAVDDMILTIAPLPVVVASSNSPVCEGDALNLASLPNGMTSYSWSGPNGFTSNQQNPTVSAAATLAMAGDYTVTVTDAIGCWDFATTSVSITQAPIVDAGPNDSVCFGDTLFITGASASNQSSLLWTSSSGYNGFNDNSIINPYYVPGSTDQANGQVTLYLIGFGNGPCGIAIDSMLLKLPSEIQVSVGSISPFVIGSNTEIEVCMTYEDHVVVQDLSYFLQAPDGITIIPLKEAEDPEGMCNFFGGPGSSISLCFTTELTADDTLSICDIPPFKKDISGTYAATGDWSNFYGTNPADGGWSIVILDYLATEGSGNPDGKLTHASITFIDTSIFTSELVTIQFESGIIDIPMIEGNGLIPGGVTYAVPLGLRTSCAGTCDALALVTVTGGTPPYILYDWDDPLIPDEDSVMLCEGIYNITVTDAMGCTGSTSVTVISPPEIIFDEVSHTDTLECYNDSTGVITVKASGGTGVLTYMLLPDIPSETADSGYFSGLPAGAYTIRVEDARGCYHDTTLFIYQRPQLILVSAEVTDSVFCAGDTNGRIEATASGGTEPYTFILEPPGTSNSTGIFINLGPGSYVVRLTDANDCDTINSDTLILGVPIPLVIDTVIVDPILCNGDTATLTVVVLGGKAPYDVFVNGLPEQSGITDTAVIRRTAGSYDISVTDANACDTSWSTIILIDPPALVLDSIKITPITTCYTDPVGEIAIYASGGTGPIEYSINGIDYQPGNLFTGLTGGPITAYYRDANGCTQSHDTIIASPPLLLGNPIVTHVEGDNLGSILLNPTGGTPFPPPDEYRYSIDGGPLTTNPLFEDLVPGTYHVHVEDVNGCPWDDYITIIELDLDVTVVAIDADCYGEPLGEIRIWMNDGTPPYDIYFAESGFPLELVYTGVMEYFRTIPSVNAGDYDIRVEDLNSRRFDTTVTVSSPPPITFGISSTQVSCHEYSLDGGIPNDGGIAINNASGGVGDFTYTWSDIGESGPTRENLEAGLYIVTVTDGNDCVIIQSILLTGQDTINAAINLIYIDPNRLMDPLEILNYPSLADDTLCYLSNWNLYATYNNIPVETLEWIPDTVLDDPNDNDQPDVSITMRYPLHIRLTITNDRCMDYDEINLLMYDTISMYIETDANRIGDSIFNQEGIPLNLFSTDGYIAYLWLADDEFDDDEAQNPILTTFTDQEIMVIGTTPDRCYEWDTAYVVIQRSIGDIYDVFTPNNDGYNDYWEIPNAEGWANIEVIIFNRWGQQIFYSKPYGIDNYHKWDGKSQKNGKDLPIGSYYYIIKYNDGDLEPVSGTVTIVR